MSINGSVNRNTCIIILHKAVAIGRMPFRQTNVDSMVTKQSKHSSISAQQCHTETDVLSRATTKRNVYCISFVQSVPLTTSAKCRRVVSRMSTANETLQLCTVASDHITRAID